VDRTKRKSEMELKYVCTIVHMKHRKNEVIRGCPKIFLGYVLALLDTVVAFKKRWASLIFF
jgi:hypothetical protein